MLDVSFNYFHGTRGNWLTSSPLMLMLSHVHCYMSVKLPYHGESDRADVQANSLDIQEHIKS
jgi:hypothetical protein